MTRVLIVDDEPRILLLLQNLLKVNGFCVQTARDGESALAIIREGEIDIVISDLRMEPMNGLQLFRQIKEINPKIPVILLTAYATVETAVEAMKSGIFDYITKPFNIEEMLACLKRAEEKIKSNFVATTYNDSAHNYRFENFIATSPIMLGVCDTIQKIAPTNATILINGDSGTGKEVVAKTIHKNSTRAMNPWIAVNCAAIPENLLESEMFGHMKGSFTGAVADKEGLFEVANGGTLFLDEISSLPLLLQSKLLRALQEHEIRRVGGIKSIPVDVRVIVASNVNLEEAVKKGTFRNDLYYRLAVITIDIPPLKKRVEDILPLVRHFVIGEVNEDVKIETDAIKALQEYSWPGNVRELENAVRHALTFRAPGAPITRDLLPPKILENKKESSSNSIVNDISLKTFLRQKEREYIEQILSSNGGDKEAAAELLKVNLSTLYRKLSD